MPTKPEGQRSSSTGPAAFASVAARWILLLPLSLALGVAVGATANALMGPSLWNYSESWAIVPVALSTALGAIIFFSVAHSIAPFWKPGVVIVLAGLTVILNLGGAASAIWALLNHHDQAQNRILLAGAVGLLAVACTALLLFLRKVEPASSKGDRP